MARTQSERFWIGGGSAAAVFVACVGWFFVVHPELSNTSSLHNQTEAARMQNVMLQGRISKLQHERANRSKLKESLTKAQAALPSDSGLAAFTQQLQADAASTHVTVSSITAGEPSPMSGAAATTTSTTSDASTSGTSTSETPTSSTPTSAAPTTSSSTGPAVPAAAAGAVYSIPVTIAIAGGPGNELAFLKAVQTGPRGALVISAQLTAQSSAGSAASMTIQLQVFTSPTG